MPPLAFLQRPARWLRAIDRYRATTSGAPNFAYDLCCRYVTDGDLAGLDLSSWRIAFCGSEPVRRRTMETFAARLAPARFARRALYPCYGLAEATLFVAGVGVGTGARSRRLAVADGPDFRVGGADIVSCGQPAFGSQLLLLKANGDAMADGRSGEIAVAGEHVSPGFWSSDAAAAVPDPARMVHVEDRTFLRTGDTGVLADGELFVVGRLKDMIIIRGANLYAEDIEETAVAAARPGAITAAAAFAVERGDKEGIVLVLERTPGTDDLATVEAAIRGAVADVHGEAPADIAFVEEGQISRSTSGKIQRGATRALYLTRKLTLIACDHRNDGTSV